MEDDDIAYFRERADSERDAAARTDDPYVRASHNRLAETYSEAARLRGGDDRSGT